LSIGVSAQKSEIRKPGELTFKPTTLRSGNESIAGELGRLTVLENHQKPDGRVIELAFVRLKSTSDHPGPPVVYLEGGPGGDPIASAADPGYFQAFSRLREVGDVILLDQRGVGQSQPQLVWRAFDPLPHDIFESPEAMLKSMMERSRKAAAYWREKGAELSAYNTQQSADDVDDLRKALGAEKIRLFCFSYGTHLGLTVINRHGANIESAICIGSVGPDHMRKLPSTYDRQIRQLTPLIAADPTVGAQVPDFEALVKRVFKQLESNPVAVKIINRRTGKPIELKVGKFGVQWITFIDIGDGSDIPVFPALYATLERGDTRILAQFVEKRFNQLDPGINPMMLIMRLASGATAERDRRIAGEAEHGVLGNVMNFPFPEIGEAWGRPDLGDDFRKPIHSNVPTLFISGSLDSNAPPFQADEIRRTFKKSVHLMIPNAGHEDMLINSDVQKLAIDFFRGKDISKMKLSLPVPTFLSIPPPVAVR